MDEKDEKDEIGRSGDPGQSPDDLSGGDLAPHSGGLPHREEQRGGGEAPEPDAPPEQVALRYRRENAHLRFGGLAIAVFVLLVAVLIACMAMNKKNGDGAETTEGGTESETESGTGSGETEPTEMNLYDFDPALVPEGHVALRPADLAGEVGSLENLTELTPDLEALRERFAEELRVPAETDGPLVLILHTHTSEGYSPAGAVSWDGNGDLARSEDREENVVAVGEILAETLNAAGIGAVHCTLSHDTVDGAASYAGSYSRAAETIAYYKSHYPTLRYVIDLHRDTVFDSEGSALRAVTEADGEAVAQVMAVVGSGEDVNWEGNLALALMLTEALNADGARLCRTPVLKASPLNGALSEYSLTLEIGTAANSLSEAKRAAALVGEALAGILGAEPSQADLAHSAQ